MQTDGTGAVHSLARRTYWPGGMLRLVLQMNALAVLEALEKLVVTHQAQQVISALQQAQDSAETTPEALAAADAASCALKSAAKTASADSL